MKIRKEDIKLSLSRDEMITYIENPKKTTNKSTRITKEFRKIIEYKVNNNAIGK